MLLPLSDIWKIDGKPLPTPQSSGFGIEDLEISAERTADGILHRQRARQGVRSIPIGYAAISQEQLSYVLKLLRPEFFELQYFDAEYGVSQITAYCSKKNGDLYSRYFYGGLWRNVTFNCIER